ncbi:MAG TPA: DNA polymerase IV, partial [Jiangellales bacterium]|nr:DNA polymerase IV [Jiangellales bacterium]
MGRAVRLQPSVLHVDLDAFFAAVEQRDKPSLRGRPVVVGGTGPRGVVAAASYEARAFGIRSAMSGAEARARCGHAAFLSGRFAAYRAASDVVMGVLHALSPVVEPQSLDEAFVDLDAAPAGPPADDDAVRAVATHLRAEVRRRTGLTASVGAATSKLVAKIASDLAKPDGVVVVRPGTELDLLHPMPVRALWGVGPATADRLARAGARTVGELGRFSEGELVDLLGQAHGQALHRLSRAEDDRPVEP